MGNRASRLLAFQLRKAQTNRIIFLKRHSKTKDIMVKPTEIAEAFPEYYTNIYDDPESNCRDSETQLFLKRLHLPTLSAGI